MRKEQDGAVDSASDSDYWFEENEIELYNMVGVVQRLEASTAEMPHTKPVAENVKAFTQELAGQV